LAYAAFWHLVHLILAIMLIYRCQDLSLHPSLRVSSVLNLTVQVGQVFMPGNPYVGDLTRYLHF
jgi:hypothetical protein